MGDIIRILYLPHTSSPGALETEHTYAWATKFFSAWVKRDPNTFVYWLVPRGALTKQSKAFYKLENIMQNFKFIEVDMSSNQLQEQVNLQPEILKDFDLVTGKYFFDVLVCEKPALISQFLGSIQLWRRSRPFKIVIANFHYSFDVDRDSRMLPCLETLQTMSALEADILQFASAHSSIDSFGLWINKLRQNASSQIVRDAQDKTHWIKPCSDIDELHQVYSDWDGKKAETFQIHFGCSINETLWSFETLYDALRKFRMRDQDFRFMVTTPAQIQGRLKFEPSWSEAHVACPRREFYQHALKSHVAIVWCTAPHGVNHGSTIELASLGVIPIFHIKSIPYPWDKKYPFLFKDETELIAILKYIRKEYSGKHVQDQIIKNIEIIDHVYQTECNYDRHIDVIESTFVKRLEDNKAFCPMKDALLKLSKEKFTMDYLVDYLKEKSDTNIDLNSLQGARPYYVGTRDDLRLHMIQNGYKDVGTPDEVIFQRSTI